MDIYFSFFCIMTVVYTRSGRCVRPPAVPHLPLPPEETDDEELDPTYVVDAVSDDDDDDDDESVCSSSSSSSSCGSSSEAESVGVERVGEESVAGEETSEADE